MSFIVVVWSKLRGFELQKKLIFNLCMKKLPISLIIFYLFRGSNLRNKQWSSSEKKILLFHSFELYSHFKEFSRNVHSSTVFKVILHEQSTCCSDMLYIRDTSQLSIYSNIYNNIMRILYFIQWKCANLFKAIVYICKYSFFIFLTRH